VNLVLYNRDTLAQFPALLNELDQLVTRINAVFGSEHDPQTGSHTDITVEGLTWTGVTQTTVGAAGAASALPANPSGYLTFTIGTRAYVLPYYAAS
jgi:hypothetical protein